MSSHPETSEIRLNSAVARELNCPAQALGSLLEGTLSTFKDVAHMLPDGLTSAAALSVSGQRHLRGGLLLHDPMAATRSNGKVADLCRLHQVCIRLASMSKNKVFKINNLH